MTDLLAHPNQTHCKRNTRIYSIWRGMKRRCHDPKNIGFEYYGSKGIEVCKKWRHSFENFYSDMGDPPSENHTIERKNNNLGYCKSNCTWATPKQQALNRCTNRRIEIDGKSLCISQWSEISGVPRQLIRLRIERGTPVIKRLKNGKWPEK